jgi:hypothetical protein
MFSLGVESGNRFRLKKGNQMNKSGLKNPVFGHLAIDCKGDIVFPGEILDEEVSTLLKFNIVNLRKVNKRLRREILREGITVYEKDRAS